MANKDISRALFEPRKHYASVHLQQGRVLYDDDWNEDQKLDQEEERQTALAVIGSKCTPDNGFRITGVGPIINGAPPPIGFTIGAGSYWLGGLRFVLDEDEEFDAQSDWIQQGADFYADVVPDKPTIDSEESRTDLIYLIGWEQPVGMVEDREIQEVALGGADTGVRIRRMRRVMIEPNIGTLDCAEAFEELKTRLSDRGFGEVDDACELIRTARLLVEFDTGPTDEPCSPPVQGGFLGAENQAIRVQIVEHDGTDGKLLWGFDNGSQLHRVEIVDGQTLKLLDVPRDQASQPLAGDTVEIIPVSATLSNDEKVAELRGRIETVTKSYDPNTQEIQVADTDVSDFNSSDDVWFLRIWNRRGDNATPMPIDFTNSTALTLGSTGVKVTITGHARPGDHWIIGVRPETPNTVVPWDFTQAPGRPPNGVREFIAPLKTVEWEDGELAKEQDCRGTFASLCDLRTRDCCNFTVGDGVKSHGDFDDIQKAIDELPPGGGTICLLPGEHRPLDIVRIDQRTCITIEGCGKKTKVFNPDGAEVFTGSGEEPDPVFLICSSREITLRNFEIEAYGLKGVQLQEGNEQILFEDVKMNMRGANSANGGSQAPPFSRPASAIFVVDGVAQLRVRRCRLLMDDFYTPYPLVFVLEGLEVEIEDCEIIAGDGTDFDDVAAFGGVQLGFLLGGRLRRNLIRGGFGPGIVAGVVFYENGGDTQLPPLGNAVVGGGSGLTYLLRAQVIDDLTPRIDGGWLDVVIEDNEIRDMGASGITVAAFEVEAGVAMESLRIARNVIEGNANGPIAALDEDLELIASVGGIALHFVEGLDVRDNVVRSNGESAANVPICGMGLWAVFDVNIEGNRVVDNGPSSTSLSATFPGLRGGLTIQIGDPVKIHGNRIDQPSGKAVWIALSQSVDVQNNTLIARGDPAALSTTEDPFCCLTAASLHLFVDAVAGNGETIVDGSLKVVTVQIQTVGSSAEDARRSEPLLFCDNEVELRWTAGNRASQNNVSVLLFAQEGDATVHGNVFGVELDLPVANTILASAQNQAPMLNVLALAATSVGFSDNRMAEGLGDVRWSAATAGRMNVTTSNRATHCIFALNFELDGPNDPLAQSAVVNNLVFTDRKWHSACVTTQNIPTPAGTADVTIQDSDFEFDAEGDCFVLDIRQDWEETISE